MSSKMITISNKSSKTIYIGGKKIIRNRHLSEVNVVLCWVFPGRLFLPHQRKQKRWTQKNNKNSTETSASQRVWNKKRKTSHQFKINCWKKEKRNKKEKRKRNKKNTVQITMHAYQLTTFFQSWQQNAQNKRQHKNKRNLATTKKKRNQAQPANKRTTKRWNICPFG